MESQAHDLTPREAQLAAQFHADVGVEHVAAVYAQAFLDAAGSGAAAALEEFDALLAEVLDVHPRLEAILGSELVSKDDRAGVLDRVLAGRASPLLLNFLKVVLRHDRLQLLRPIHRQAHRLWDERSGRIRVQLITAVPVDAALVAHVAAALQRSIGGQPVIDAVVQPDLIGGAVMRIGDTVYDASVATQLDKLRQRMIDRSVHEIQSRRDRFRHPAGN